jgi:hypothetical protein
MLFGLLFFVIGGLWLYSIFQRGQISWPTRWNYTQLLKPENSAAQAETRIKRQQAEQFMPNRIRASYECAFRGIVIMELIAALLYIISAVSLFRLYPVGRILVLLTLLWELCYKLAVIIYQQNVAIPLSKIFKNHNIVFKYLSPQSDWTSAFSVYMSGLDFLGKDGEQFLFYYLTFLFLTFTLFSKESLTKTFGR